MKVRLPSRLALALGTLTAGLVALSGEVKLSHPLHQVAILLGAFVLFMLSPLEGSEPPPKEPV